ncbi:alcohol dehydrogenase [Maribellus luteus]|uniref:alcohol dehydrogenase n=1 Tax=Maribellus luteus TaxID=2305463 RepID=A0A399STN5_9BACT|nr:zinc-binding dehydrogenase [Maribellus luteus]RIJ45771.1 alcohol dehydrogenase [Maribellus luteus]
MSEIAKARVFSGIPNVLDAKAIELPFLGNGEILVKNSMCSICKSDLHTLSGTRPGPTPSILGHEIVGEIVALPANPVLDFWGNQLKTGDLITWTIMASCGECSFCKRGLPQKCVSIKKYGHEKMEGHFRLTGGFASHTHLYPGTFTYKLPGEIDKRLLAGLNCSWATVVAAIRNADEIKGKNVLITGAGMLGLLAVMICREKGAAKIVVCDKDEQRLDLTKDFGADLTLKDCFSNSNEKEGSGMLQQNALIDVFLEMTGSNEIVQKIFQIAGIGASIVLAGSVFPVEDVVINPEHIVRRLLQIKGVHNYTPNDLGDAIMILQKTYRKYPFEKLFDQKTYGLENIDEAVAHATLSSKHRVVIGL